MCLWVDENVMFVDLISDYYRYMEYLAFCRGEMFRVLEKYLLVFLLFWYFVIKFFGLNVDFVLYVVLFLFENVMISVLDFVNACLKSDYFKSRKLEVNDVKFYFNFLNWCFVKLLGLVFVSEVLCSFIDLFECELVLFSEKVIVDVILVCLRYFVFYIDVEIRRRVVKFCGVFVGNFEVDVRVFFMDEFLLLCKGDECGVCLEY